jgi:tetratricopeptide (TPR) repeat protein
MIFSLSLKSKKRFCVLLLLSFLIAACVSHVKELREAQSQFNQAASLENELQIDMEAGDAIAVSSMVMSSYRQTVKILSDLLDTKRQPLQEDNLLGTAYTLKAYAEWRLGDYEAAVTTSTAALEAKLFPRDLALITALRGLIKNDQAYYHMQEKDYAYRDIKRLLEEALEDITKGLATAGKEENIRIYLLLSELIVLKNWTDLRGEPRNFAREIPADLNKQTEISAWCRSAQPVWAVFQEEVNRLRPDEAPALIQDWSDTLAVEETCPN